MDKSKTPQKQEKDLDWSSPEMRQKLIWLGAGAIITSIFVILMLAYVYAAKNVDKVGVCSYSGGTYEHGQDFDDTDGCNTCTCTNGQVSCTTIACEVEPTKADTQNSASCLYEGKEYQHNQGFTASDGCNSCSCTDGQVACTLLACDEDNLVDLPLVIDDFE